jgi:thymidine kinase
MILPERTEAGHLLVITGNMMSGKTEELIARLTTLERVEQIRAEAGRRQGLPYTPRRIGVYKHALDTRYSAYEIASHSGRRMPATPVASALELHRRILEDDVQIAACDEVQFFLERDDQGWVIVQVLADLLRRGLSLLICGLDKDFRGMPFGPMGDILALADERVSLVSVCVRCGAPAVLPQRLINGQPARWDDPLVYPGAAETYEPRCRRCHQIEGGPTSLKAIR